MNYNYYYPRCDKQSKNKNKRVIYMMIKREEVKHR